MEQGASMDQEQLGGMRILVVDDEEAVLTMIEAILRRAGYSNVDTTSDPLSISERYANDAPDLLILDLRMPGMDGFEILGRLRPLNEAWANLPILVMTGDESPGLRERALSMGARDFLSKPVDASELVEHVHSVLADEYRRHRHSSPGDR